MPTFERQPTPVSDLVRQDRMFAHDEKGAPITRERSCECGARFTQTLLSERFLAIVERQSKRAIDAVTRDVPGYYVPKHCPPCERRDLGHNARLHEARQAARPFGDRDHDHAAD